IAEKLLQANFWLGNDIDGAGRHRLHRRFGALFSQRRTDHHRRWPLRHDLAQKGHPIHTRHFDIEDDDIRPLLLHFVDGEKRIGSGADDLDLRIVLQQIGEHLPHYCGVVDDQYFDFIHGTSTTAECSRRRYFRTHTSPLSISKIIWRCPLPPRCSAAMTKPCCASNSRPTRTLSSATLMLPCVRRSAAVTCGESDAGVCAGPVVASAV